MIRRLTLKALLAAALFAAPAFAQDQAQPPAGAPAASSEPTEVITVTGNRREGIELKDYAMDFVLEIGDPPTSSNGYARWGRRICLAVEYAPPDAAQYLIDRISEVAIGVGLRPQGPGCTPNINIAFTTDGAALASRLVEEEPQKFRPYGGEGGTTQGSGPLVQFATSDAAVRWWQVMMVVDWMGQSAITTPNRMSGAPTVTGSNSRIVTAVQDELWNAYVIVDATKVNHVSWEQLADYIAMVSLAQIDPNGSTAGFDSILNLFASSSPPGGLTDWDESYLAALYDLDRRLDPRHQRGVLANLIARHQLRDEAE